MLDTDLRELLALFRSKDVEFLVVGGHAVAFHAHRRLTLTRIYGVEFSDAWAGRVSAQLDDAAVWIIGRTDLIRNKRATGRTQDLADAEFLERLEG